MSGGHGEIEGLPKCPVCDRALPFLCPSTDFGISFRVKPTIKDAIDHHCNKYEHEPLWNCLPTLALKPMNLEIGRREKVTSGCVQTFLDYTLRQAARAIPLPTHLGTWITEWTFAKCVLLSRLSFARERTSDPTSFMKDWTDMVAAGKSNDAKRAWIRQTASKYLQQLIENVMSIDLATTEEWEWAPSSRRRNTFQLFFLQGNHRECGLLKTSLFPALPDVAAAEPKTAGDIGDGESDHGEGDQDKGGDKNPFPDEDGEGDQDKGDDEIPFPDEDGKSDQDKGEEEKPLPDEAILRAEGVIPFYLPDEKAESLRAGDVIEFYDPTFGCAGNPSAKRSAVVISIDPTKSMALDVHPHQVLLNSHPIKRVKTMREGKLCDDPSYYREIYRFTLEPGNLDVDPADLYRQQAESHSAQIDSILAKSRAELESKGISGEWLRDFKPSRKRGQNDGSDHF